MEKKKYSTSHELFIEEQIGTIKIPEYVGDLEIVEGFVISLTKMPSKKHQENMEETFGWKFTERKTKPKL